jgi:Xaa-Pro dipeptidase
MNLDAIQTALRESSLDGWLFYDHHHRDPIAARILGLDPKPTSRAAGTTSFPPIGRAAQARAPHRAGRLDSLPGAKGQYSSWQELHAGLEDLSKTRKRSPCSTRPTTTSCTSPWSMPEPSSSCARLGKEIVTSADLVSQFEAVLTEEQIASHRPRSAPSTRFSPKPGSRLAAACVPLRAAAPAAVHRIRSWSSVAREAMRREGLVWENGPDVSVNANTSDSHYEPTAERSAPIREGDFLLIDIWGRLDKPGASSTTSPGPA